MERLQKKIAAAGIASRRKAEELIAQGRVTVNGNVVTELGTKVSEKDYIEVDHKPIEKEEKVYFLFNKPPHTICSVQDEKDRETVLDYFSGVKQRVYPVGRLDYDTTGLLILTNDGEFANHLMHPRHHLGKTYIATIQGILRPEQLAQIRKGVELEDGITAPCQIQEESRNLAKGKSILEITIYEGKNHEVKRIFEFFGTPVMKLHRKKVGFLELGTLRQGEYRKLKPFEVKQLLESTQEASNPKRSKASGSGSI